MQPDESATNSTVSQPAKPPPKRHQSSCPDLGTTPPLPTVNVTPMVHRASVVVSMPPEPSDNATPKFDLDSSIVAETSSHSSPNTNKTTGTTTTTTTTTTHLSSSRKMILNLLFCRHHRLKRLPILFCILFVGSE